MSFLDKITKAVSDTVDRGKKEVDQFMRIQKVKGEITEAERRIQDATNRINEIKRDIGDRAVTLLRAGALAQPDLRALAEPIGEFESDINVQQQLIADKKAEIERIKAEDEVAPPPVETWRAPAAAPDVPAPPVAPPPPVVVAVPPPPPAVRPCPTCGKNVEASAAFCTECGAKL